MFVYKRSCESVVKKDRHDQVDSAASPGLCKLSRVVGRRERRVPSPRKPPSLVRPSRNSSIFSIFIDTNNRTDTRRKAHAWRHTYAPRFVGEGIQRQTRHTEIEEDKERRLSQEEVGRFRSLSLVQVVVWRLLGRKADGAKPRLSSSTSSSTPATNIAVKFHFFL